MPLFNIKNISVICCKILTCQKSRAFYWKIKHSENYPIHNIFRLLYIKIIHCITSHCQIQKGDFFKHIQNRQWKRESKKVDKIFKKGFYRSESKNTPLKSKFGLFSFGHGNFIQIFYYILYSIHISNQIL